MGTYEGGNIFKKQLHEIGFLRSCIETIFLQVTWTSFFRSKRVLPGHLLPKAKCQFSKKCSIMNIEIVDLKFFYNGFQTVYKQNYFESSPQILLNLIQGCVANCSKNEIQSWSSRKRKKQKWQEERGTDEKGKGKSKRELWEKWGKVKKKNPSMGHPCSYPSFLLGIPALVGIRVGLLEERQWCGCWTKSNSLGEARLQGKQWFWNKQWPETFLASHGSQPSICLMDQCLACIQLELSLGRVNGQFYGQWPMNCRLTPTWIILAPLSHISRWLTIPLDLLCGWRNSCSGFKVVV